jgi:hypothetical protein
VDRSFWRVIANDANALPQGEWVAELTPELLSWLGSTDAELRDEFAYRILAGWIDRDQYKPDQLRGMAAQMTANLLVGLGEDGTDSVFLRSYSALVLMEIVAYDDANPFLEPYEVEGYLDAALDYLARERDLRGYVPGAGWANAIGHTADLLMMLARHPHLGAAALERILEGIAGKLLTGGAPPFVHHEDERLAYAVLNVLRRDLVGWVFLRAWLERFLAPPGKDSWRASFSHPAESAARANVTAFLRSLYFQILLTADPPPTAPEFVEAILATLKGIDIGYYELA